MPSKIISFGYRHGKPPEGTLIDVRSVGFRRNPYHDHRLRKFRGTDSVVQEDVAKTPRFTELYTRLLRKVSELEGVVCLGCTGGHHRSVTLAEMIGRELNIPIEHRDIGKPLIYRRWGLDLPPSQRTEK